MISLMELIIKKISLDFAPQLITIQKNDGFKHAYYLTKERLGKLFSNGEEFFGAFTENNSLVGFASINTDVIRIRIHFLSIDQQFQGNGIGSALIKHILSIAKDKKVRNIYVYTEIDSPLETFLLKRGFAKAGYFKKRFGDKDADILSFYL